MRIETKVLAALVVVAGLALAGSAGARTIRVPSESPSIAHAFAQSSYGDHVVVSPGYYPEHDLVLPPGVSLLGETGQPEDVVIDAQGQGRVLICEGIESDVTISGLSLRNGVAEGTSAFARSGGGIFFSHSEPLVTNCEFVGNRAEGSGGALRVTYASPELMGCRFIDNEAAEGGGAVELCLNSAPSFNLCHFEGNSAAWGGAVAVRANSQPTLNDCSFVGNISIEDRGYGGAIYCDYQSAPMVRYSTMFHNEARFGGAVAVFQSASLMLSNCSLVENTAMRRGQALFCLDASPVIYRSIIAFQPSRPVSCEGVSEPQVAETDIFGNGGEDWVGRLSDELGIDGNISLDPLFCNRHSVWFDLHLRDESPCTPENSETGVLIGALEAECAFTSVRLSEFDVRLVPDGVDVVWGVFEAPLDQQYRVAAQRAGGSIETWFVDHEAAGVDLFRARDRSEQVQRGGEITYTLATRQGDDSWVEIASSSISIPDISPGLRVDQAWPNPFNPATTLSFSTSRSIHVRITVHDVSGRIVALLADRDFPAGGHSVQWAGRNDNGQPVPSGTYFAVFHSDTGRETRKLTLLK